jgi:hypothetical protein
VKQTSKRLETVGRRKPLDANDVALASSRDPRHDAAARPLLDLWTDVTTPSSPPPVSSWFLGALVFGVGAATACSDGSKDPPTGSSSSVAGSTLDVNDPSTCEACHGAVVAEWRESQHARAHHVNDAVYAALRTLRTEKQGADIPGKCATCHNPRDTVDHDSAAAKTGVSCATCHQIDGVHLEGGKKGTGALVASKELRCRGPHDIASGTSPVHQNGPALPEIVDGKTLCLACHGEEKNPAGVLTCSTGIEHAASGESKGCTSCHMEEVPGPSGSVSSRPTHRSHRFRGSQLAVRTGEPGILAEAVLLSGAFEAKRFVAKLENRSGHAYPTGFPGRTAMLEIRGLDAKGDEVYRNLASDPMKDHPEAVFNMGFVDADDKPTIAAFATKLVRDTRLKPAETRTIGVEIPDSVAKVELRLRFLLVPPPLAKAIGYSGPETKPIVLSPVVVTR